MNVGAVFHFAGFLAVSAPAVIPMSAAETVGTAPRGGRVGWARLVNTGPRWNAHAENDAKLAEFIRTQTSLNMDSRCYPVQARNLEELCSYPFVFTNDLAAIGDATSRRNLAEFIRRGGFIYVDGCVSPNVTPNFDVFLRQHTALFKELVPAADFRRLPESHSIYNCYFAVNESDFHLNYVADVVRDRSNDGFYGVFVGERMVALVSSRALQCAWKPKPFRIPACSRMIVNIYVYAMTHATELASRP